MLAGEITSNVDYLAAKDRFALRRVGEERLRGLSERRMGLPVVAPLSTSVAPRHDPASATFLNRTHCIATL